jgi:DNA-binding IscR family transcriptional regulator
VVEPEGFFAMHENPTNPACQVSCSIKQVLGAVFKRAETSMHAPLRETSVADLLRRVGATR